MRESSIQILLAEYERLKAHEEMEGRNEERSVQLYLTVITLAAGAILFFTDNPSFFVSNKLNVVLVLGVVAIIGEVTYLRLLGHDITALQLVKRFQKIRDEFIQLDPQLANVLPKPLVYDDDALNTWISFSGIIDRVLTFSGDRTTVGLLNSLVFVCMLLTVIWPKPLWILLVIGGSAMLLFATAHLVYSSWRYRRAISQIKRDTLYWKHG